MNQLERRFKRLALKALFSHMGKRYRKASKSGAYAVKDNGTSQTNAVVPFARNTWVKVTQ